jgi:hypothetical protein
MLRYDEQVQSQRYFQDLRQGMPDNSVEQRVAHATW